MAEKVRLYYNITQHLIVLLSFIYSLFYWKQIKRSYLKLFPLYILISLIIGIPWYFKYIDFPSVLLENIFILFEFFIFYNFYLQLFKQQKIYKTLYVLALIFLISFIVIPTIIYNNQTKFKDIFSLLDHDVFTECIVIGNVLIVIPALFYYKSLFYPPYIKNLSSNPVFLIMTGILFCFATSIPVFLFQRIIVLHNRVLYLYLYMINAFGYITMHLFIIRAYMNIKNV